MKLVLMALLAAASVEPKQRTFEFTYVAELDIPENAGQVQMWLPYPTRGDFQEVRLLSIDSPVPTKLYQEYTYRNSMLFLSTPASELEKLRVEMSFRVTRREHRETEFAELEDPEGWVDSSATRYLRPDRLVPSDERIRERAAELTEDEESVVEKARAIFDYVVDGLEPEATEQGWKRGDVTLFAGLARAAGIAVRLHFGFVVPLEPEQGEIGGHQSWAEFWVPGFGWVPVDTVGASAAPGERDDYFGANDANRVELSLGCDVVLNPKQAGQPLAYFVYPFAEIDGKPADDVRRQFFYKDLDLVAE